jgi:hypothetical protein
MDDKETVSAIIWQKHSQICSKDLAAERAQKIHTGILLLKQRDKDLERIRLNNRKMAQTPDWVYKSKARRLARLNVRVERCCRCGSTENLNRHHENYDKPLDVIIVCSLCHHKIHSGEAALMELLGL